MSIRLATTDDAAAIAGIYEPFVTGSRITFEEEAPDLAEMARRIAGTPAGLYPWLVAEQGGTVVGFASSSALRVRPAYRWTVETGLYLAPEAQGQGLGRALLERMVGLLERQGFVSTVGAIALPNPSSVALHMALGFTPAGLYRGTGFKQGEWVDVSLWQKDLAPRSNEPVEPRPFAEIA